MNEYIINRIKSTGVTQRQIAEVLVIDETVFCRMLQKELYPIEDEFLIVPQANISAQKKKTVTARFNCVEIKNLMKADMSIV